MQDKASELRKEDLLEGFLRQLGFEHDLGAFGDIVERKTPYL